jgi:DNA-directed RNA polymerase subunit RPC12/RpoP
MTSSGRLIGSILIGAGLVLGAIIAFWLLAGMRETNPDGTQVVGGSGAIFGFLFGFLFVVAPLVGGGIYFLNRGRAEEKLNERARGQRRLLDMLMTRGQLSIVDVALELGLTREQIESDLYDLVGLGLFTGYVDWRKGVLHSVEAAQLEARTTCPNCGGELELAGKGLIKCPYCGAEIFLGPDGTRELQPVGADAISAGGSTR